MSRKIQRVILLIDSSGSMDGKPIENVKNAIKALSKKIDEYNSLSSRIELQIISFATTARYISKNNINSLCAYGRTNLADAYKKLNLIFKKHTHFDYAPIIMLLCDGEPNLCDHTLALKKLKQNKVFNKSLKIAFAYGKQDEDTLRVLQDFTGNHENVLQDNRISTIKYVLQHSLPMVIKRQAKQDNKHYEDLMKIIANDVRKYNVVRNAS